MEVANRGGFFYGNCLDLFCSECSDLGCTCFAPLSKYCGPNGVHMAAGTVAIMASVEREGEGGDGLSWGWSLAFLCDVALVVFSEWSIKRPRFSKETERNGSSTGPCCGASYVVAFLYERAREIRWMGCVV